MATSKHIDKICCIIMTATLLLTFLFINAGRFGVQAVSAAAGYASRLFNTAEVHTIDIIMDDWDSFIETCTDEQYTDCAVVIDGESFRNVAIRAKGNTSLSSVAAYGNDRYSFKIEFDHYDNAMNYYGLDKLCLNNIIQDNTYMKDYLTYRLMHEFGVDSPLCSYVYITVNGQDWGLYLAVEGVEESFLARNYGNEYGELYKPDSMDMGGGRGNGGKFDGEDFGEREIPESAQMPDPGQPPEGTQIPDPGQPPEGTQLPDRGQLPENVELPQDKNIHDSFEIPIPENTPQNGGIPANDDVSLIYTDDSYESYNNIFDNAKTDITNNDKERLIASLKALNEGENIADIVDTNQVIRYFVVHNFVCNFDSYTGSMIHNYYLYEEDGRMSMIPWDYNLAFGGFESGTGAKGLVNYPIDSPICGGEISSRPMLAWIFENKEYTELYHTYFDEFITEYLGSGIFTEEIDNISQMIAPYVEKDPTKFCTYEEFEAGAETLKKFCLLRAESITGQLNGTIPSTSEEQKSNSSALIDADGLNITDMGSMR